MTKTVASIMSRRVVDVPANARMPEIERLLIESRVSGCPVIDESGRVCGVLSRSDIVRRLCTEHTLAEAICDYYTDISGIGLRTPEGETFEDIAQRVGARMDHLRASDVMSREIISVESGTTIRQAAAVMSERALHRLPVIDDGRLVGVVSSLDIVRLVAEDASA